MLFHFLQGGNRGVDIEQFVGYLDEDLDESLLIAAWDTVARARDVLRTRYQWTGVDRPLQEVVDTVSVAFASDDLSGLDPEAQQARLDEFLGADRMAGFALDQAPLWRVQVFRLGPRRTCLVFTYHHSLLDTSVVWVVEEMFRVYDASRSGAAAELPERAPFRSHVAWLGEHLDATRPAAVEHFAELLDGFDETTRLVGLERPVPLTDEGLGYGALRFGAGPELSAGLHAFHAATGIGAATVIEAAWALVLAAFSGSTDVVYGSTRGGRHTGLAESESVIGLFINTVPVRVRVGAEGSVLDLLGELRAQQVAKRPFEHTALADIQGLMPSRGALFDTCVVINELHQGTRLRQLGGPFAGRRFDLHDQTNFPLTLLAYTDADVHFKLSYDVRRFDAAAIDRVADLFTRALGAIVADPEQPVGALPRVPGAELAQMQEWNATARDYARAATIHDLFHAQVDRAPDAVALAFRDQRLTYRELDARANGLAAHLRQLGVGPDVMVGVHVERSVEMLVGLLAILKAGGAYVPMDPYYPAGRLEMMLEDSRAEIVLTTVARRGELPASVAHAIAVDEFADASPDRVPAAPGASSADLAYVIFTSGSTGRPKGVMVEHRNVVNFFAAMDDQLRHDPAATPGTWLAVTSISFDISVLELFWTLTRGLTVVLQEDEFRGAPAIAATGSADGPVAPLDFSLFYFAADSDESGTDRYRLLIEGAKFADTHGFAAVWTPERHFHQFGGLYPNPAVTSAAVAMVTERVSIRAGSVVLPLHHPIRCAEDWAVVDNLSNGRVGLSFASGWHANDFALAPDNFADRRRLMAEGLDTIRALWRGEAVPATAGDGREISVRMFPKPVQDAPPMWITAGGSPETFAMAGRLGANILTNLLVMKPDDLVRNVAAYRDAYRDAGHPGNGHVSLMLHTFVGTDLDEVRRIVREPFLDYLRTSTDLINQVQWEQTSFARPDVQRGAPGEGAVDLDQLSDDDLAVIMDHAFERYFSTAGLFGTPESCLATIARLRELGVDEVACLIDFGIDGDVMLDGLVHLDRLRQLANSPERPADPAPDVAADDESYGLVSQVARHGVTHLQCTPSLAAVIVDQPGGVEALARLDQLLLGGEALPVALVDRIRPTMRGRLLNMYGPTETTIWSTVSEIAAAGEPITIGRPIANTQVYMVDRNGRRNPVGVPGELLIGGDGVVRGYLDRPELTAERFIELPGAGRVYRTGDLARLRGDGEIEFSGRLDHQVKVRGYRIELGEIETAIGRHPGVLDTVVVARTDQPGEPRLVAYVVPRAQSLASTAWADVWDEAYAGRPADGDPTFDISGWNSSYDGAPIPADEMAEWVDLTVARIAELEPQRVLEIGFGTGLLLYRLAPKCREYVGVDVSHEAVAAVARNAAELGLGHVSVAQGAAHEVASLVEGPFDTIVINSVIQYFPGADYLVDVLTTCLGLLAPGGAVFVGDVRSKRHHALMAAAVELARAADDTPRADVAHAARRRQQADAELVVDEALFPALRAVAPDLGDVRVRVKAGRAGNEMSRFRYDVVLRKGPPTPAGATGVTLAGEQFTVADVHRALTDEPGALSVRGLRNDRLVREAELVRLLELEGDSVPTAGALRAALDAVAPGVHPDDLVALGNGHAADVTFSADAVDRIDVAYRPPGSAPAAAGASAPAGAPWDTYTNRPAASSRDDLVPGLREHLRRELPDFMIPSAFLVLDALPRTPNGKIDRNALPAPDRGRLEGSAADLVAPETDAESVIAGVWQDMLSLDAVGVETNLFDLGANSLMMVQAAGRIGQAMERNITVVEMFRHPTVRALAVHLSATGAGRPVDDPGLRESQDRAQLRRESMQRRRGPRPGRGA